MKTKLITITIIVLATLGIFGGYTLVNQEDRFLAENCPDYQPNPPGFVDNAEVVDCKGNIAIEKWQGEDRYEVTYYSLSSGQYKSEVIVYVTKYHLTDTSLYYIEDMEANKSNYGERCNDPDCKTMTKYFSFFKNGQTENQDYESEEEIPMYRKINLDTGESTLYDSIESAPENERSIFEELTI